MIQADMEEGMAVDMALVEEREVGRVADEGVGKERAEDKVEDREADKVVGTALVEENKDPEVGMGDDGAGMETERVEEKAGEIDRHQHRRQCNSLQHSLPQLQTGHSDIESSHQNNSPLQKPAPGFHFH